MSGMSRIDRSACESSIWLAESSIVCRVSRGSSTSSSIAVSAARVSVFINSSLSFDIVLHTSIFGAANIPTTGAVSVTLTGSNFGLHQISMRSAFGFSGQEASSWISTSSLVPKVPRGTFFRLSTAVSSQLRASRLANSFTFDLGVASQVPTANIPTTGASQLLIMGFALNTGSSLSSIVCIS
jgi:hypothetical protein